MAVIRELRDVASYKYIFGFSRGCTLGRRIRRDRDPSVTAMLVWRTLTQTFPQPQLWECAVWHCTWCAEVPVGLLRIQVHNSRVFSRSGWRG